MAAAIGADLPLDEPMGNMVIDIGGGTTESAVISMGGIVSLEALRKGSFDIDAAIQAHARRAHGLAIGERTAEEIKKSIGTAVEMSDEQDAEVRGRDIATGLPKTVVFTAAEIREAINEVLKQMIDSVGRCLAEAPAELHQDFLSRGMYLVGGGAMLRGLDIRITRDTKVPVVLADQPLEAVVLGAGHCIENFDALEDLFMESRRG
jgi:rod shape-determining protein MreB